MREILFRGKAKINGHWDYGDLLRVDNKFLINGTTVEPETVGQYILKDTNNKRLFENDIVLFHYFHGGLNPDTLGYEELEREFVGVVQVDDRGFYAVPINRFKSEREIYYRYYFAEYLQEPSEELEIIGNIFDNPDLLSTKGETC